MKKRLLTAVLALCLAAAALMPAAFAADVFRFAEKSLDLFEGENGYVDLVREGKQAEDGVITWTSSRPSVATVDENGIITAVSLGNANIVARITIGNRRWDAQLRVNVKRRVESVALNTERLAVFERNDPDIMPLLAENAEPAPADALNPDEVPAAEPGTEPLPRVLVFLTGRSTDFRTAVEPRDASDRAVVYTSSDPEIFKINNANGRALKAGECELTVASRQNPEVTEQWHILVLQPVTGVKVTSDTKQTFVGDSLQLGVTYQPENAGLKAVTWTSGNPKVAAVDEYGTVIGLKRGAVTITAKAKDGSGKAGSINITVAQQAEEVQIKQTELNLAAGERANLNVTVLPSDANDKHVTWVSSDEGVATVDKTGRVTAVGRGQCMITAISVSNAGAAAAVPVNVIQKAKEIRFLSDKPSVKVNETVQLEWTVLPEDTDIKAVTWTSANPRVATVDANGLVTGLQRGTVKITAKTTDGSNRTAAINVSVIQPVTGIHLKWQDEFHIQIGNTSTVTAIVEPTNANNQNVIWSIDDEMLASVRGSKNVGYVTGRGHGYAVITAVTEEGGFAAQGVLRVTDYNRTAVVDDIYIENEKIRLVFRNRNDFALKEIYFEVELLDADGKPLPCNKDGSNVFHGKYPLELLPEGRTQHNQFKFTDYVQPEQRIGMATVYITGWKDETGYTWNIGSRKEMPTLYTRQNLPTSTPAPDQPTPTPKPPKN
ncbi:MAG: Ig-like domain-containing protein [Clostridia bacterium]|nr:Ig-like domain-containing protein [Clostridia bacterium]